MPDWSDTLNALAAAVHAAGGGEIILTGMVRCDRQIVIPSDVRLTTPGVMT